MPPLLFTVAHAVKRQRSTEWVHVYRTHHRARLATALRKVGQIRRAGYLVWIERTGSMVILVDGISGGYALARVVERAAVF